MKIRFLLFTILMAMLVTSGYGYRFENTLKRSFSISNEGTFRLNSLRGNIKISTHNGSEIKIMAYVMSDDHKELEKVNIKFEGTDQLVTVSANGELMAAKVQIDYKVKVPAHLKLVRLVTQTGEINARGKYGAIDFKIGNGEIDFKGRFSSGKLQSANGDIDVKIRGSLEGDFTVKSANGDIVVELKESDFTVSGSTSNGSIRSEHRAVIKTDNFGSKITGTVNKGTHKLTLTTVNGDIKLLRD
jgi:DUF4097 and DUF4098 domain-containing protein YvlB